MHTYHTLPRNCKKFWGRRYKLFSRFDDGIYMTSELWYSVTPESIAQFSASLIKYLLPDCNNILDVCCGGGGNTIQFAYLFDNVGGIDIKDINVQCTVHNAEVYEVADRIWTHVGDWNEMSAEGDDESVSTSWIPEHLRKSEDIDTTFDMIFCSPPWGGTSYNRGSNEFDLYQMEPFAIDKLLESMLQYTQNIALFLPKSSNLDQLRE
ncbi:RNA cap guanine-N2 methyltransferase-domain-containing protein, partial [Scheffersomyces coipomensis]|uniref:RNA cap guanine-N2 methyltransferase-domain-containing protein n=1 Tax=Scheffersomyces coipomensis TaxID=1788519 RepID=UPI00315DCBC6